MKLFISSINGLGGYVTPPVDPPVGSSFSMIDESFGATSIPIDWGSGGTWAFNGSGAEASGTGGMTSWLRFDENCYLDRQKITAEFTVDNTSSKFAIGKHLANRGNLVTADLSTDTLYLGIITSNGVEANV